MPYLHCPFTLLLTDGSGLTPSLNGRFCTHYGPVPVVPTKRPHAGYPFHIHTCLDGRCALTHGPLPIVPTIRPHVLSPLHIHTAHDGWFCTLSRERTSCDNKSATCRISIAHSQTTMNLTRLFRREAIGRLYTLILPCPTRCTLSAPVGMNGLISVKPFLSES